MLETLCFVSRNKKEKMSIQHSREKKAAKILMKAKHPKPEKLKNTKLH